MCSGDIFFFFFFLIYLAAPGLCCGTWDIRSLMQHVGSLAVARELLAVARELLAVACGV